MDRTPPLTVWSLEPGITGSCMMQLSPQEERSKKRKEKRARSEAAEEPEGKKAKVAGGDDEEEEVVVRTFKWEKHIKRTLKQVSRLQIVD
jgi:hypothetical protein